MHYGFNIAPKNLLQQMIAVRRQYPAFSADIQKQILYIKGSLQPTPRSDSYEVKIVYHFKRRPVVSVVKPQLVRNFNGDALPHVYPGNTLCLYQPKYYEFRGEHLISETIIPWTSLWLYYYEAWHITGDWLGGGEHVAVKK